MIARIFLPQWAPMTAERSVFWQFDPLLGWSHIPSTSANFSHPDFTVKVNINSDGLRGREYPHQRTDKKRMLIVGDSYGWGFGVADHEVFSQLLEANHPDWEVINASVSGYGTVQQYLYYRERGYRYEPDIVLLLFYDNDFDDNIGGGGYWYNKPVVVKRDGLFAISEGPVKEPSIQQKMQSWLLGHFYLGRIFYFMIALPVGLFERPEAVESGTGMVAPLPATGYVLGQLAQQVQSNRSRFVIVNTPLSDPKQAEIEAVCTRHTLSCLALDDTLPAGKHQDWHFEHDRHWNARGHALVASSIDDFLAKQGIWTLGNPQP